MYYTPIDFVVIYNQDSQACQANDGNWVRAGLFVNQQRQDKPKARTFSQATLNVNLASHELYELLGNGQP